MRPVGVGWVLGRRKLPEGLPRVRRGTARRRDRRGHLLLSGIGVGALFLAALGLRLLAPRDAVLRYRLMVAALFTAVLLLPLQALIAELTPRPSSTLYSVPGLALTSIPVAAPALSERGLSVPAVRSAVPAASGLITSGRASAGAGSALMLIKIYLAGATVVVGFHAVRALAVRRLLRRARPVTEPRVLRLWGRVVVGLRRRPDLLECDRLHAPACRALGRPAVIIPIHSESLDDETLLTAMRHELVHLRRCDGAVALLGEVMAAALWFQPLVWVFVRVLRDDREHSCDALVVRTTCRPRSYALALLRFCDPPVSARRVMPLIGFESARSIHRRIAMLAYALQPAARPHRAVVLGLGVACLVSASAAHALLTAAAGPDPTLTAKALSSPAREPQTPGKGDGQSPLMRTEVRAAPGGRSDPEVFRRLVKQGVIAPSDLPTRDLGWAFPTPAEKSHGVLSRSGWVADQETLLSASDARAAGSTLHAQSARLRLPEGSKLRAVFEGRAVNIQSEDKGGKRITIVGGTVRIVDEGGVTRVQARADSERGDATLTLTSTAEGGELDFRLSATDGSGPVSVRLDTHAGVPDSNGDSRHGAARWELMTPRDGPGACELRILWMYDIGRLARSEGC